MAHDQTNSQPPDVGNVVSDAAVAAQAHAALLDRVAALEAKAAEAGQLAIRVGEMQKRIFELKYNENAWRQIASDNVSMADKWEHLVGDYDVEPSFDYLVKRAILRLITENLGRMPTKAEAMPTRRKTDARQTDIARFVNRVIVELQMRAIEHTGDPTKAADMLAATITPPPGE